MSLIQCISCKNLLNVPEVLSMLTRQFLPGTEQIKGEQKKLDKIGLNIIYQKILAYGPLREQKQENQLESTNGLPQF